MADDWLTYEQAGERLGVSPEGARQRAIRGRWQRTKGNDGKARVRLPDGHVDALRTPIGRLNKRPVRTPSEQASDAALINALEAHVATLKHDLAAAEARLAAADAERAKAISAFADLAERLDTLAADRRRPWWRRLAS
jgi:hypothetical protein